METGVGVTVTDGVAVADGKAVNIGGIVGGSVGVPDETGDMVGSAVAAEVGATVTDGVAVTDGGSVNIGGIVGASVGVSDDTGDMVGSAVTAEVGVTAAVGVGDGEAVDAGGISDISPVEDTVPAFDHTKVEARSKCKAGRTATPWC